MFLVLSGKKGSGKDTICAEIIKRNPNLKIVRIGLADYLKEICINLYGLDKDVCFGLDKNVPTKYLWEKMPWFNKEKHNDKIGQYVTHREFLQYFGSEICRSIDDSCWVNSLLNICKSEDTIYCITDVRFPSELIPLMSQKSVIIRLLRSPYNDTHQSEIALDNWPFYFDEKIDNTNVSIEKSVEMVVNAFNCQAQVFGINERLK